MERDTDCRADHITYREFGQTINQQSHAAIAGQLTSRTLRLHRNRTRTRTSQHCQDQTVRTATQQIGYFVSQSFFVVFFDLTTTIALYYLNAVLSGAFSAFSQYKCLSFLSMVTTIPFYNRANSLYRIIPFLRLSSSVHNCDFISSIQIDRPTKPEEASPTMSVSGFRHHFVPTQANETKSAVPQYIKAEANTTQSTTSSTTSHPSRKEPSIHNSEANVSFRHHYLPPPPPTSTNNSSTQSLAVQTWLEDQARYEAYDQALEISCRQGALAAARRLNSQLRARKTRSPAPSTMEPSSPVESVGTEVERLFNESESSEKRKQVAVLRLVKIATMNSV